MELLLITIGWIVLAVLNLAIILGLPCAAETMARRMLPYLKRCGGWRLKVITSGPAIVFTLLLFGMMISLEYKSLAGKLSGYVAGYGIWFSMFWVSAVRRSSGSGVEMS